jgi:hypothetical protein
MSGAYGSAQTVGALSQHLSGSLITTNIFFAESTTYRHGGHRTRHRYPQLRWWPLTEISIAPPGARHRCLQRELPTAPPRGAAMDISNFSGGRCHHRRLQLRWWPLPKIPTAPPGGPPSTSPTSVVVGTRDTGSTPMGPAIDVSNFGDGRCWKYRQHPPRGPPSTSSTLVVVVAARHAATTARGAAINVSNFTGGRCQRYLQHPPRGPPSTSPTSVLATVGDTDSTPSGPTVDVFFNFGGGRCRTYQ